jgi:hypothetical protein
MDISKAWGYGAIVLPRKLAWQGFAILSPGDKHVHAAVGRALASAAQVEGETTPLEGTIAATLVFCMTKPAPESEFGVAVFASALSEVIGHRFWILNAYEDPGGTRTEVVRLEVSTPEAAREAINSAVLPLRMGQALYALRPPPSTAQPTDDPDNEPSKGKSDR